MEKKNKPVRALGLCSGGLDSMLAGLVLRDQDIDVAWVTFETPFFNAAKARKASNMTGIPLTVKPIFNVYMKMLKNPPAGYGKHMNPCMDCHTLMFKLAGELMQEKNFDFLFSGEVLGQRPMSQNKASLGYVEKHSGFKGYIVRPLSAKNLPLTIPEREGLVDRDRLLDISGRGRNRQIKLAEEPNGTMRKSSNITTRQPIRFLMSRNIPAPLPWCPAVPKKIPSNWRRPFAQGTAKHR